MPDAYRAFIALDLPDALRDHLGRAQQCLKDQGIHARWVRPAAMHLTLKFLGQLPLEMVDPVAAALDRISAHATALQLTATGLGVFPNQSRPRVLWMGIGGESEQLMMLQRSVEEALSSLGWPEERRPFQGHLTLARVKGRRPFEKGLADMLAQCESRDALVFRADCLALYRSRLQPEGAVHDKLRRWPLNSTAL
jgi:2'-5' RNA ligase